MKIKWIQNITVVALKILLLSNSSWRRYDNFLYACPATENLFLPNYLLFLRHYRSFQNKENGCRYFQFRRLCSCIFLCRYEKTHNSDKFVVGGYSCIKYWFCLFVWFDSLHPNNNLSVIKGQVFLGWTSTKLGLMCLAQGHNAVMLVRLDPRHFGLEASTLPLSHCTPIKYWIAIINSKTEAMSLWQGFRNQPKKDATDHLQQKTITNFAAFFKTNK